MSKALKHHRPTALNSPVIHPGRFNPESAPCPSPDPLKLTSGFNRIKVIWLSNLPPQTGARGCICKVFNYL